MPRLGLRLRLFVAALTLTLIILCRISAWAVSSKEEICDVPADLALGLEDYPEAIALHRKVLLVHNDNALAHYHLGFAYGMTGHIPSEITEYLVATRLGLRQWDLFLNLGLAYFGENDYQQAIRAFQIAVLLGPDHPEAHFNLALAYERHRKLREALQQITTALWLAPSDSDEHNTKAIICLELGNRTCARDEWTHLVRVVPDYMPAQVNLANMCSSHLPSRFSTSPGIQP